jgi:hypothetical protein
MNSPNPTIPQPSSFTREIEIMVNDMSLHLEEKIRIYQLFSERFIRIDDLNVVFDRKIFSFGLQTLEDCLEKVASTEEIAEMKKYLLPRNLEDEKLDTFLSEVPVFDFHHEIEDRFRISFSKIAFNKLTNKAFLLMSLGGGEKYGSYVKYVYLEKTNVSWVTLKEDRWLTATQTYSTESLERGLLT